MREHPLLPQALSTVWIVDVRDAAQGDRIDLALASGVTALWLRDPPATGRALYDAAGGLVLRCRRRGAALLVGDRVDVALAVGADGVQLGARSVPPGSVRRWFPGWIGVSCHGAEDLVRADEAQADHVVLSPVYGVPEKGPPLGLEGFTRLARVSRLPVVALGGLGPETAGPVRAAGAVGVAVIRALRDAPDLQASARALAGDVTGR